RCYRDWSSDVCSSDLFLLLRRPPGPIESTLMSAPPTRRAARPRRARRRDPDGAPRGSARAAPASAGAGRRGGASRGRRGSLPLPPPIAAPTGLGHLVKLFRATVGVIDTGG